MAFVACTKYEHKRTHIHTHTHTHTHLTRPNVGSRNSPKASDKQQKWQKLDFWGFRPLLEEVGCKLVKCGDSWSVWVWVWVWACTCWGDDVYKCCGGCRVHADGVFAGMYAWGRHDWFYYTSTKCAIPDDMYAWNHLCRWYSVFVVHAHAYAWFVHVCICIFIYMYIYI